MRVVNIALISNDDVNDIVICHQISQLKIKYISIISSQQITLNNAPVVYYEQRLCADGEIPWS